VQYGRLVDIGRNIVEKRVGRPFSELLKRAALRAVVPNPALFGALFKVGQFLRPLLPGTLKHKVPKAVAHNTVWPEPRHARRMLVLDGCVQPSLAPDINPATARVLDRLGVSLVKAEAAGCCGAVTFHLNRQEDALDYMRRNIDAWWPHIEAGAEAVVMTASGCGTMVKEYGHVLARDPAYAEKAKRMSDLTRDISEVIYAEREELEKVLGSPLAPASATKPRIAFHSPCSLQHGLQIHGKVEDLLTGAGFELTSVPDSHLCCGSAGTFSILQRELSQKLLKNKVNALESGTPALLATANIGCLTHIQSGTALPVRHWIELLDERLKS
jgi:glycolate oxidase iron-sulfur subunit